MPGSKIPVLEIEKLTTDSGGRGFVITDDAANFDVQTWTGKSLSGATYLPAPSAIAWLRITSDGGTAYYAPLFEAYW